MEKLKSNIYVKYSFIFIVFMAIALIPSQIKSNTFLSFGLFTDGFKQHLVFMQDYVMQVKSFFQGYGFPVYRFDLGLGSDFFMAYSYYSLFDPLTIIAYIIPIQHIEISYYLIAIIRLYLSGLFVLLLLKKMGFVNPNALLAASVFYAFNITALYSFFRHPMFINGIMFLPLIILGVEKIMHKESSALLIGSAFLALISQFYIFFFICVGFEMYVWLRVMKQKDIVLRKKIKTILNLHLPLLVGILLGSFALFPQIIATLSAAKLGSLGLAVYNIGDYFMIISAFYTPAVGNYYTTSVGNFLVFFCILVFIVQNRKHWASVWFIALSIMICIPIAGFTLNAFSYVNNRWTFIMLIPATFMLANTIEKSDDIEIAYLDKAMRLFIGILAVLLCAASIYLLQYIESNLLKLIVLVFAIIVIILLYQVCFYFDWKRMIKKHFYPVAIARTVIVLNFIVLSVVVAIYFFGRSTYDGLKAYDEPDTYDVLHQDDSFFRVDQKMYALKTNRLANDNIVYRYNSTYQYNTMSNKHINQVMQYFDVPNLNASAGYNGFNNRITLNAINHVKYLLVRESEKTQIPYGFVLHDTIQVKKFMDDEYSRFGFGYLEYANGDVAYETMYVYRNEHFLDFGMMYQAYTTKEAIEDLSAVSKEALLLDAIILENSDNRLTEWTINDTVIKTKVMDIETNGLTIYENQINVFEQEGTISFVIDNSGLVEVFVGIEKIKHVDDESFIITYETETTKEVEATYAYATNFYFENKDHLVCLGTYDEKVNVTITILKGKYQFEDIYYYQKDVINVSNKIDKLNQETLNNLKFSNNGFSGEIEVTQAGMLFIALPYDRGFTAYVNGELVTIEKANIGYMAIFLEEGNHRVTFVYKTPGLLIGAIVSASVFIIISTVTLVTQWMKKKGKKKNENN